jgi:NAD(P)-dependent dehydrogenase (short-subunit alcohol dehydrogenase family)
VSRVLLITGAASGFGRAIAGAAIERGDRVVATARKVEQLADLQAAHATALDVTDAAQREAVVAEAIERFGRIDVLVNNAGRTQVGAVEETTEDELRSLFELHFFAPAALTRAVLPHMRAQAKGAIVQMSSVGGQTTAPGFGAYCATKFALEGFSEALSEEVAPFGVRVLIVEPGAFRTGLFRREAAYFSEENDAYRETVGATRAYVASNNGSQPGDPAKAAAAILAALDADDPPLRLVLGADAIESVRAHLQRGSQELSAWEATGRDTAFERAPG